MADPLTMLLARHAIAYAAAASSSSYSEPTSTYSEPAWSPPSSYQAPRRFPGRSPSSQRDWDNVVEHSVESRWTPSSSKREATKLSELDIDAYVDIRSRELATSRSERIARYTGTGLSKISPLVGPRLVSLGMEGVHKKNFGIRDEDTTPTFRREMRRASGRDFETISQDVTKSAKSFGRKTVRAWNHDNREEALGILREGAKELSETLAPHATHAVETFAREHQEHAAAVGGPILHGAGVLRMAHRGHQDTKSRLGKTRETCVTEAKRQHKSKLGRAFDKISHRKFKSNEREATELREE